MLTFLKVLAARLGAAVTTQFKTDPDFEEAEFEAAGYRASERERWMHPFGANNYQNVGSLPYTAEILEAFEAKVSEEDDAKARGKRTPGPAAIRYAHIVAQYPSRYWWDPPDSINHAKGKARIRRDA